MQRTQGRISEHADMIRTLLGEDWEEIRKGGGEKAWLQKCRDAADLFYDVKVTQRTRGAEEGRRKKERGRGIKGIKERS